MALTSGLSMDEQVARKADAYRNNPAALQKNYQISQNLLDLLALQKLKSEKEAAERELQMSQQQNPKTIAQQRGEEAVSRTKDEIIKQVGGVTAQNQRRQQQNLQQAAAGAPATTGIATQSAPNMARMAGGGIVTFQSTGTVGGGIDALLERFKLSQADYNQLSPQAKDYLRRYAESTGKDPSQYKRDFGDRAAVADAIRMTRQKITQGRPGWFGQHGFNYLFGTGKEYQKSQAEREQAAQRLQALGQITARAPVSTARPAAPSALNPLTEQDRIEMGVGDIPATAASPLSSPPPAVPAAPRYRGPFGEAENPLWVQPGVGNVQYNPIGTGPLGRKGTITAPDTTRLRGVAGKAADIQKQINPLLSNNPVAAGQTAFDTTAKNLNRSGVANIYSNQLVAEKNRQAAAEKARAGNEFYSLLARAGGQGALANMGRAYADQEEAKVLRGRQDLTALRGIEDKGVTKDIDIAKAATASGEKYADISSSEKRTAMTSMASLLNSQTTALSEEARILLETDRANLTEAAAHRRDKITLLTADSSNELQAEIHNENARLTKMTNKIRRDANNVDRSAVLATFLATINNTKEKILASQGENVRKAMEGSASYQELQKKDPVAAAAMEKRWIEIFSGLGKDHMNELDDISRQIQRKLGLITGVRRVS